MNIKGQKEKRAELVTSLDNILKIADKEGRNLSEEENIEYKGLEEELEIVEANVSKLEKQEARKKELADDALKAEKEAQRAAAVAGETASRSDDKEIENIKKVYSCKDMIGFAIRGEKPDGLVAEMHQEAQNETRAFGSGIVGLGVPARLVQSRADVTQGTSAIQPTVLGGYQDGLRENSLAMKVGVNVLDGLTADYKIPYVGINSVAWATGENSTAADGGAEFTTHTLNPNRITGKVDISNRILLQNGEAPVQSIMRDLGAATAETIDLALFPASSVTNAPAAISQVTNVGTFTEVATWVANTTVNQDFVEAEKELLLNKVSSASGKIAYVASPTLLQDLKQAALVSNVSSFSDGNQFGFSMVNGYPCYYSTAVTADNAMIGDWSKVNLGFFGGLDIIRDPYSALLEDQTRLVLHRHCDFGLAAAAGFNFIKWVSLIA